MIKNITNLGDAALYCDFGEAVNLKINSEVINYFYNIKEKHINGITNITPSYNKLIISYDLKLTNFDKIKNEILSLKLKNFKKKVSKIIKVPVCCEKEYSLDIIRLESILKISKKKILKIFFSRKYYCYMTGFIAGMPFLGDLENNIRAKRLETPRTNVPKGSIGLTEKFCNIYTFDSPGGWNIIGKTPLKIFNKLNKKKLALINPGDTVIFYEISLKELNEWNE